MVIDGAHFNDGFHVNNRYSKNTDVGTVPQLLLKSGVFNSPDKNPKLDIYNVTAAHGDSSITKNRVILHAMKCFPNSAIKVNEKIYTSENIKSLVRSNDTGYYLNFNSNTPIEVIRDAWGVMESVTLDGKKIDYFKDWKGTVENLTNDTAHTLKFEWNPLASELVNAGYTYRTKCEHYISGSTAVQQTDTIAADKTSHTITIPESAKGQQQRRHFHQRSYRQAGGESRAGGNDDFQCPRSAECGADTRNFLPPRYGCRQRLHRGQHQLVYEQ